MLNAELYEIVEPKFENLPIYMHVTSNLSANNENCSFSNFTKSSANFSIFSWKNRVIVLEMMTRSKPYFQKIVHLLNVLPFLPVKCGLHLHEWCMNKVPNWRFVWVHCLRKWLCWSPFHNPECISMYFQWYKNSTSKRVHYVHCWRPGHYQSDKQINRSQCAFNWVFTLYCSFTSLRRYHTVWYSCWWMFLAWVFLRLNCRWSYYFWCTIQTVAKVLSMLQREQINVNFSNIHVASDTMNSNRPVMVLILHTTYTDSTQYAVKKQ